MVAQPVVAFAVALLHVFCVFSRFYLHVYGHLVFFTLFTKATMNSAPKKSTKWLWVAAAIWFAGLAMAFGLISLEGSRAGAQDTAPQTWPQASRIELHPGKPTIMMFMHPRCPCSSASLAEFERLMARLATPATLVLVFVKPQAASAGWEESGLYRFALNLEGVTVLVDEGGAEARRFGARTSGHVVVYGPAGELAFQGGITSARGHEGDNAGRQGALNGARLSSDSVRTTEVYGCQLDDEECLSDH